MNNVNYHLSQKNLVSDQVSEQDKSQDILHAVLDFCITEKSKQEICSFIGYRNLTYFTRKYWNPLLASGQLKMTIPDKPNSRKQKIYYRSYQIKLRSRALSLTSPIVLLLSHSRLYSHHLSIHPILNHKFQTLYLSQQPNCSQNNFTPTLDKEPEKNSPEPKS